MEYEYFAVKSELADLIEKVENFYKQLRNVGQAQRIQRSYAQYYGYGIDSKTDRVLAGGEQGELSKLSINKYRTLLRHQLSLITAERPATHVTPINTDHASLASALVGEQILDYYMRARDLEDILFKATEIASWSSEGYIVLDWDSEAGDFYAADDEGKAVMTGDVSFRIYGAASLIRDIYEPEPQWYITQDYVNKWDYAARFPEHREEILASGPAFGGKWQYNSYFNGDTTNGDRIALYRFYHKKTPALPEGRLVVFTSTVKLFDSPLPFAEVPIYDIKPAMVDGTNLGYTQGFDLLASQEVLDELYTAVVSNNLAFSRQCVVMPRNTDVHHRDLVDGLTLIEADGEDVGKIRALQLTNSSPETYALIDRLKNEMESMTGINEVVMGAPGPNVRSGNAMALLSAQALKFNSTLQQSYVKLIEDVGTATLKFLQNYATAPRFVEIVSKSQRAYLKEFSARDLTGISRVHVEIASALSKTQAGRVEIANNLLQNGLIGRPDQYITVLTTGKLDPVIEAEQSAAMNIKAENESLGAGEHVPVLFTDNHAKHINEHKAVLDSPDARRNPGVVQSVLDHIQEHLSVWQSTDPNVLAATGQQIMAATAPPSQAPTGSGQPPNLYNPGSATTGEIPDQPSLPNLPQEASPEDQAAYESLQQPT